MKENFVIITRLNTIGSGRQAEEINAYLADGWTIESVTSGAVARGNSEPSHNFGNFLIVLERFNPNPPAPRANL